MSTTEDSYAAHTRATLDDILRPLEGRGGLSWYGEHIAVATPGFLRHLADAAQHVEFVAFYGDEREGAFDRVFGEGGWEQDNTYNYNEPYTSSMVVVRPVPQCEGTTYTVAFAPHYGGDVRGNYGDFVVVTFKDFYDFVEACDRFYDENRHEFELDGRRFECCYTGAGEWYRLCEQGGDFDSDGFCPEPDSEADFIKSVREALEK